MTDNRTVAPAALFQGYDSFLDEPRAAAVTGQCRNTGTSHHSEYKICRSVEELHEALNITASVAATCGFGSLDAKTEFTRKLRVTEKSVHVVVYAQAITESLLYTGVEPAIASVADVDEFFRSYGDSWVSSIERGGEYAAVYSFYSQSSEEQQKVVSSLQAEGIGTEGKVTVNMQATFQRDWSSLQVETSLMQFMHGVRADIPLPDEKDIIPFSLTFATHVSPDTAVTVTHDTSHYLRVPGFRAILPPDYERVLANVQAFKEGRDGDQAWAKTYAKLTALVNGVKAIQEICHAYGYFDEALHANGERVQKDRDALDRFFRELARGPAREARLPTLACANWQAPILNVSSDKAALSDGHGDQGYTDAVLQDVMQRKKISRIVVRGARVVDSMHTEYRKGPKTHSTMHGGDGGDGPYELNLADDERITGVDVRYGDVVNQLNFITSKSNSMSSFPSDPRGCDGFRSWRESGSTRLLGFSGNSGRFLDHVEVVTVTFAPTTFGQPA